jgi:hypothetical protein
LELAKSEINRNKRRSLAEIKNFETKLAPIQQAESVIENEVQRLEEEEKKVSADKRSQVEKERWELDIKRRDLEKDKWQILEEMEKVEEKIKEAEQKTQQANDNQDQLKKEKTAILNRKKEEELLKEKTGLREESAKWQTEETAMAAKENELAIKKNELENELAEVVQEENITEDVIREMTRKEREATNIKEQRKIEKERWKVEDDRKGLEKKRWQAEEEMKEISSSLNEIKSQHQEILNKKNSIESRIKEINQELNISPEQEEKELAEAANPIIKKEEVKPQEKPIVPPVEAVVEEEKTTITPKMTMPKEEKPTIKEETDEEREERRRIIREEMKKRIAQAAAERNGGLPDQEREEEPVFEEPISMPKPPQEPTEPEGETKDITAENFISVLPQKPSMIEKVSVRIVVIAIIALICGFIYWFFFAKNKPETVIEQPPQEEETITETEPIVEVPELVVPESSIPMEETLIVKVTDLSEMPTQISSLLESNFSTIGHARIVFEKDGENRILGLTDFLQAFEVNLPEDISARLMDDFTLFIYAKENENRLGFIATEKTLEEGAMEEENLASLILAWEKSMITDTDKLFLSLGREGEISPTTAFKQATHQGTTFRYLSFPQDNFGLCWAVYEDKFIFTSSGESIIKSLDKLQS